MRYVNNQFKNVSKKQDKTYTYFLSKGYDISNFEFNNNTGMMFFTFRNIVLDCNQVYKIDRFGMLKDITKG